METVENPWFSGLMCEAMATVTEGMLTTTDVARLAQVNKATLARLCEVLLKEKNARAALRHGWESTVAEFIQKEHSARWGIYGYMKHEAVVFAVERDDVILLRALHGLGVADLTTVVLRHMLSAKIMRLERWRPGKKWSLMDLALYMSSLRVIDLLAQWGVPRYRKAKPGEKCFDEFVLDQKKNSTDSIRKYCPLCDADC